jgi:hypothetical protein
VESPVPLGEPEPDGTVRTPALFGAALKQELDQAKEAHLYSEVVFAPWPHQPFLLLHLQRAVNVRDAGRGGEDSPNSRSSSEALDSPEVDEVMTMLEAAATNPPTVSRGFDNPGGDFYSVCYSSTSSRQTERLVGALGNITPKPIYTGNYQGMSLSSFYRPSSVTLH